METPVTLGGIAAGLAAGLPVPTPAPRRQVEPNATLVWREDLTPAVARFVIRPDSGVPDFKPGQYFALGLDVDGAPTQRPYSTASAAGTTDELEFLIRRVASGAFTPRLWEIAPGSRVWLGRPKGLFTLHPDDERTHLFVSSGTGLAPFISMAEWLLRPGSGDGSSDGSGGAEAAARPRVVVVHGVSYVAELAYRDRLEAWSADGRLAYVPAVSRPDDPANAGWTGATGRAEAVLGRACEELGLDAAATVAYLCGNPDMIEAATALLMARGFPDSAVIREHYWTAVEQR